MYFIFLTSTSWCHSSQPGATTRKSAIQVERQNSEISYYADDEDGNRKKYTRRGESMSSLVWAFFLCVSIHKIGALIQRIDNGSYLCIKLSHFCFPRLAFAHMTKIIAKKTC